MAKFIARRLLLMLLTMLFVSIVIFVVSELAPGNIARNVLGAYATPEQEESFLAQLGLDRSLHIRYISWLLGSDWQAERRIGLPLKRIQTEMGYYEWWAEEADGVLVQWGLEGSDLVETRRYPDGTSETVVANDRWHVDDSGARYFWGVDKHDKAVKWVIGADIIPSGAVDLRFSDGTLLSDTDLRDTEGLSVHPNAGAKNPNVIPTGEWIVREIDLSSLAGHEVAEVLLAIDYRGAGTQFPVQIVTFVDEVEIVKVEPSATVLWSGGFGPGGSDFSGTFAGSGTGEEGDFASAVVDAEEEGVGASGRSVYKASGSLSEEQSYVHYSLFKSISIPVEEDTILRYRILFSPLAGGEAVWTLTHVGWVSRRGGPVEYIPIQKGFLRGDPGESIKTGRPVVENLFRRLRNSVLLATIAFAIIMPIGLVLGLVAGLNQGRFIDRFLSLLGLVTTATPQFATGVMLILVFASWLNILPGATVFPSDDAAFKNPQMLVLPVWTLTLIEMGYILRITRASMVDVMREPYIRTASLKGLPYWRIVFKHALRNALIAPITVIMLHVNWLIGGIVVVEAIFGFPGLGKFLYDAALFKDVFAMEAGAMVMVLLAVGTQLVADVIYTFLNPRIRYT